MLTSKLLMLRETQAVPASVAMHTLELNDLPRQR
jgi:hypothetical protein